MGIEEVASRLVRWLIIYNKKGSNTFKTDFAYATEIS